MHLIWPIVHKILPWKIPLALERNQTPFLVPLLLSTSQLFKKCIKSYEIVKIQHNTSLFHSKKRHNTSCLGTRKARLPIFFGTIVKFHCLALIWIQLSPSLFLLLCWAMVESLLTFFIWQMFHLQWFLYFLL
jgi:hypothetical protein